MTHHHLGFEIADRIKSDTDHNQDRGTAERNVDSADRADNNRENGYNA